jgi:hypothetical protein
MPEYSTGISQPAKGTMRAPCAWWRAFNGVFFNSSVEGWLIEARGGTCRAAAIRIVTVGDPSRYYAVPSRSRPEDLDGGPGVCQAILRFCGFAVRHYGPRGAV